jgi:hypothetical protein
MLPPYDGRLNVAQIVNRNVPDVPLERLLATFAAEMFNVVELRICVDTDPSIEMSFERA